MKTTLFSLAAFFFLFTAVRAQSLDYGVKAGLNISSIGGDANFGVDPNTVNGDQEASTSSRTTVHFGFFAQYTLDEQWAFRPELIYSAQGGTLSYSGVFSGFTITTTSDIRLDYLQLPLLGVYTPLNGLQLQAGPQLGLLINAEAETTLAGNGDSENSTEDIKDSVNGFDFGVALGASYQLQATGFFFDARYSLGLSNINDSEGDQSNQNNVFQLGVGYRFN
ncbi:porin family protein [Croceiramulus getboli]|nr:porin family protein [Flavobacteriaceae bacterium YJPT1-3]